jgi:hypothetical protein
MCHHVQAMSLPAAPETFSTWVDGFGFRAMTEQEEALASGELPMLIFDGSHLLIRQLECSQEQQAARQQAAAAAAIAHAGPGSGLGPIVTPLPALPALPRGTTGAV